MIANSFNTKAMASELNISSKTVENHRVKLMRKLGIFDTAGLTREAIRQGVIDL